MDVVQDLFANVSRQQNFLCLCKGERSGVIGDSSKDDASRLRTQLRLSQQVG